MNPRAGGGRGREALERIERLYREAGIEFAVAVTDGPGDAASIAEQRAAGLEAVVAVGGDGTVHEVVNGLATAAAAAGDPGRVAALAIIAVGTGNDFLKSLAIAPTLEATFEVARAGIRRRIDLGRAGPFAVGSKRIEREWFVNEIGAGLSGAVVEDMRERPFPVNVLSGHLAYLAAGFRSMFYRFGPATVRIDGEERRASFYEIHAGNGRFCGGGIQFTPRAELDDGLLDVTFMHSVAHWRFVKTMLVEVRRGTLAVGPGVDFARGRRLEIERGERFAVCIDGECRHVVPPAGGGPARLVVEVAPAALDVLAPGGSRAGGPVGATAACPTSVTPLTGNTL